MVLKPASKPQIDFLQASQDIVIYGGAAGGGKTWAILVDALRYIENPKFGAVIFRRTMAEVKKEGGLWDASFDIYPHLGGKPNLSDLTWTFPSGAKISLAGLEHEKDREKWSGTEICGLYFDELQNFTESQFFFMLSRNRSICGIKPYLRATCNPAPNWLKTFLGPWVDREWKGVKAQPGQRLFWHRENGQIIYSATKDTARAKTMAFIPAKVTDNVVLMAANPEYLDNLANLPETDRKRLLEGDWNVLPENMVLDQFSRDRNVLPTRSYANATKHVLSMDFGGINTAWVLIAEELGRLIVYAESWEGVYQDWKEVKAKIDRATQGFITAAWGGNRNTEQGWRQAYRGEGIPFIEPDARFADPKLQYSNVNRLFGASELFIDASCVKTINMIENFQRDIDKDSKQPLESFDDTKFHLCAALRYGITGLRPPINNTASSKVLRGQWS